MISNTKLAEPPPSADNLHRAVKMAVDNGEVATVEDAYELFKTYRLGVRAGHELAVSPAHQAALMTMVNTARRALLGGVYVAGELDIPLLIDLPGARRVGQAVEMLGGQVVDELPEPMPTLTLGAVDLRPEQHPCSLNVVFSDWRGGVIPCSDGPCIQTADAISPAAILAGAIAVSEVFQHLRGNPMAGRRKVGLSLWSPESVDWASAPAGPTQILLPSRLWLIGLGHLGQAYLWVLGLLPYKTPSDVMLVLQDFDRLAKSNDSTSLLTHDALIGRFKTRAMADWAEARGFETKLVERRFPDGIALSHDEPRVALGGVDNMQARACYEDAGFDWIVEAGLGAGPREYLAIRLHTFPASAKARDKWGGQTGNSSEDVRHTPAYDRLANDGMDECGLVQMASRTVGARLSAPWRPHW